MPSENDFNSLTHISPLSFTDENYNKSNENVFIEKESDFIETFNEIYQKTGVKGYNTSIYNKIYFTFNIKIFLL